MSGSVIDKTRKTEGVRRDRERGGKWGGVLKDLEQASKGPQCLFLTNYAYEM